MDKGKNTGNPQNEASPKYQDIVMNGNGNVISMQEGLAYDPSLVIDMFLMMSNADKAKLVSTLFPIVTEAELLAKFDELYPDYIFPNTKQGDLLFHPLIGKVEITKASDHKLGFYGNGQEWVCDRNGHLIVNGKTHDRRLLFHDLKDYNDYMKGE